MRWSAPANHPGFPCVGIASSRGQCRCTQAQRAVDLLLKPGRYEYRYVVDGRWMEDPMAPAFTANPFGDLNSVMIVQASAY